MGQLLNALRDMRDNLARVPANSDLQRRYLATLDRQETDLEALAKRRAEADKAVEEAAKNGKEIPEDIPVYHCQSDKPVWVCALLTASGTVYVLERLSDGARASVEVSGRAASAVSVGVGTAVAVSVIGTGVLLSAAGEVLAFIPNELGRALLHNERITH